MQATEELKRQLAEPALRRVALIRLAEEIRETVLYAGAEPHTAYLVAGEFVRGIQRSYEEKERVEGGQARRRGRRGPYLPRE